MERNLTVSSAKETSIESTASRYSPWLKRYQLLAFFGLAFAITWGGWFLLLALQSGVLRFKLDPNSLTATLMFRFSGWGPTISAIVLTALVAGKGGLREYFRSLARWRVGLRWYAVVLFTMTAIILAVMAVARLLGWPLPVSPYLTAWYSPFLLIIPAVFVGSVEAGIAEEPGWRGYALPHLLSRFNPLTAALILGVIWGLWHLPIYILDADTPLNFLVLMLQTPALSILIAWAYINTKRSTLMAILFHGAIDGTWVLFLNNTEEIHVNGLLTAGMWVAALIVLAIFGTRLSRQPQEG
jgi:membrane protease YdiL (CAAX protease family)